VSTPGRTPHCLLIGMMGVGKTTIGGLLAQRLGWGHLDSDRQVEAATGRTVVALFAEEGEAAFRAAESAALREALAGPEPQVISVAGGAVIDPGTRALVAESGFVVWLRADPSTLAARLGDGDGRPLLDGDTQAAVLRLDGVRRPLYAAIADLTIDVDALTPDEIVDEVVTRLPQRGTGGFGA
jgi:shikimate kinase